MRKGAIFVWPWKIVSVSVRICFISQWIKRSRYSLFVFPPKKTLVWRRHWSIGQSCCSMTSKRGIGWFLESSRVWRFFARAFAQPTKSRARLYPFDKPMKSFVVSVLFACFHFKVIRKSLERLIIVLVKTTYEIHSLCMKIWLISIWRLCEIAKYLRHVLFFKV